MVCRHLETLSPSQMDQLRKETEPYLRFRADVADFQEKNFSKLCTQKCFQSQTSACCGREGIVTFFADVVINRLICSNSEVEALIDALTQNHSGLNCVYLTKEGCLWRLKPIVCEMFLCDYAKETVLGQDDVLRSKWEELRRMEKRYTWPDRPVLFDRLEALFIEAGYDSPLMYLHHSPGLLRLKARQRGSGDSRVGTPHTCPSNPA